MPRFALVPRPNGIDRPNTRGTMHSAGQPRVLQPPCLDPSEALPAGGATRKQFGFASLAPGFCDRWRRGASGHQRVTEAAVTSTPTAQDHAKFAAGSGSQVGPRGLQGRHPVTSRAFASGSRPNTPFVLLADDLNTLIGCRQQPPMDSSGSLVVAGCLTRRAS
jgi:hypothetical protein